MKKVKLYIVTYNSSEDLNQTLNSCFSGNLNSINFEVNVINNHSNFEIDDKFKEKVNILHNVLRPDFSKGHLSRNWNQAIINGFKSLISPECDILVTCQDDTIFEKTWLEDLLQIHEKYSFYAGDCGDMICSYLPEAVRKIGLWDERFCNIQFQEADYFLRANIYNSEESSIMDFLHSRTLNPTKHIAKRIKAAGIITDRGSTSNEYHSYSLNIFEQKWGNKLNWNSKITDILHSKIPSYFYYPYFERDIYGAKEKGYVIP